MERIIQFGGLDLRDKNLGPVMFDVGLVHGVVFHLAAAR